MPLPRRSLLALAALSSGPMARPALAQPAAVTLFAENAEPFTFRQGQRLAGIGVDIVEAMGREAGVPIRVEMLPWARAYAAATEAPNTGLCSTFRTDVHELLFHWVGRIADTEWALFARRGAVPDMSDEAALKRLPVAGSPEHAPTTFLNAADFTIEMAPTHEANIRKLEAGRIQLWGSANPAAGFIARRLGIAIEPALVFRRVPLEVAMNPQTDPALVEALRRAHAALERRGTLDEIRNRYLRG